MENIIENITLFNNDISEIMSEYIYESILIEADNSGGNKVKEMWNKFITMIKRMFDKFITFVRNLGRNIKDSTTIIEVPLYDSVLNGLQNSFYTLKSSIDLVGEDAGNISIQTNTDEQHVTDFVKISAKKAITLYKGYIERCKKIIDDANKLINSLNADVAASVKPNIDAFIVGVNNVAASIQKDLTGIEAMIGRQEEI